MLGTSGCRILSLTTEFKYSPSQCGKGAGIKREWAKSGRAKICRKVVKVLNLGERKPQLLVFFGFMGMWFHFVSISDQKPPCT